MPTGGEWTPLKNKATGFVKDKGQGAVSPEKLLSDYLRANGGARVIARGSSGGGSNAAGPGGGRGSGGVVVAAVAVVVDAPRVMLDAASVGFSPVSNGSD